jgi:hypothetical protein
MLHIAPKRLGFTTLLFMMTFVAAAQDFSNPGSYMSYISTRMALVNQTYMNYLSAASHGKSVRKVDKLREKAINTIFNARMEVQGMPPLKKDKTLKDAMVNYLKTCYIVFNEDYSKIVNMEEIAEQSYDAMEAYLLAQEKAGEKLDEAARKCSDVEKEFAATHQVNLIEQTDKLDLKMEKSNAVNKYYNKMYLLFFKTYKQEAYVTLAINNMDVNGLEQNRNALIQNATAGLEALNSMEAFDGDNSLLNTCKKVQEFYKQLAESRMETSTNFLMLNDNFKKIKKAFDAKPASKRTQADTDAFNNAVNEINKASENFNKSNKKIDKERNEIIEEWNKSVKRFMDKHMPYAK